MKLRQPLKPVKPLEQIKVVELMTLRKANESDAVGGAN